MSAPQHYEGQRLSLKGRCCTVRYVGSVGDKPGEWLGVEWDDTERGKHDGAFEGKKYFKCHSTSSTAASFLRPTQSWDSSRTFLRALTEKYMSTATLDTGAETVYISGKQAEEVGFGKFSQRQAKLQGIHVLVLDRMRIQHATGLSDADARTISELCADITVLDLSSNLFETVSEVVETCALFPKLRSLTLDGNRFRDTDILTGALETVRTLSLSRTLLNDTELSRLLSAFPALEVLVYADNEASSWRCPQLPASLTSLDLSGNDLESLADIQLLDQRRPDLETLSLQNNKISTYGSNAKLPAALKELSLAHNAIGDWAFFDALGSLDSLRSVRVTGNPLYAHLTSAEGNPMTSEDGYMLTIARLPRIEMLNYSKISDKERLNAETYYLGQIGIELSMAPAGKDADVRARHPRYGELCEEYGEPTVQRRARADEVDPRSLAARLVTVEFRLVEGVFPKLAQRRWRQEVPKSFDVYAVLGLVGKRLNVSPLAIGLTMETGERDPTLRDSGYGGPGDWDSSDEDGEEAGAEGKGWTTREVELVPGTRALGTYVEGRGATIKVRLGSNGG